MDKDDLRFLLKDKYGMDEDEFKKLDTSSEVYKRISSDIQLLKEGIPRDYVIGYTEFLGTHIDLSLKPLIPRIETEYWVEKLLLEFEDFPGYLSVLDIFCGSGCIGVTLLNQIPSAHVTFSDISKKALDQTRINLGDFDTAEYELVKSDVWENINEKFDLIVANPPYIGAHEKVQKSTKFEPQEALLAGEDGMDIIREFLEGVKKHLLTNGQVWMEFGSEQKDKVEGVLSSVGLNNNKFFKDQFDRWRWVVING